MAHRQLEKNVCLIGMNLVYVHLNYLKWFLLLIRRGSLLLILIGCAMYMPLHLDVVRMSTEAVSPSFSLNLIIWLHHVFFDLWSSKCQAQNEKKHMHKKVIKYLIWGISYSWALINLLSYTFFSLFFFFCNLMSWVSWKALMEWMQSKKPPATKLPVTPELKNSNLNSKQKQTILNKA